MARIANTANMAHMVQTAEVSTLAPTLTLSTVLYPTFTLQDNGQPIPLLCLATF